MACKVCNGPITWGPHPRNPHDIKALRCVNCGIVYAFDPHKRMEGRRLSDEEAREVSRKLGITDEKSEVEQERELKEPDILKDRPDLRPYWDNRITNDPEIGIMAAILMDLEEGRTVSECLGYQLYSIISGCESPNSYTTKRNS